MKTLATSGLCLLVAACASYDGYSLRAGVSTESEVRSVMGMPANEFANADGSKRLAYPRGPLGTQTYMADVDTDGILKAVTPVLRDETFYRVQPGLTRDDIVVDIEHDLHRALPCLKVSNGGGDYDAYLAAIPGSLLADIFYAIADPRITYG